MCILGLSATVKKATGRQECVYGFSQVKPISRKQTKLAIPTRKTSKYTYCCGRRAGHLVFLEMLLLDTSSSPFFLLFLLLLLHHLLLLCIGIAFSYSLHLLSGLCFLRQMNTFTPGYESTQRNPLIVFTLTSNQL